MDLKVKKELIYSGISFLPVITLAPDNEFIQIDAPRVVSKNYSRDRSKNARDFLKNQKNSLLFSELTLPFIESQMVQYLLIKLCGNGYNPSKFTIQIGNADLSHDIDVTFSRKPDKFWLIKISLFDNSISSSTQCSPLPIPISYIKIFNAKRWKSTRSSIAFHGIQVVGEKRIYRISRLFSAFDLVTYLSRWMGVMSLCEIKRLVSRIGTYIGKPCIGDSSSSCLSTGSIVNSYLPPDLIHPFLAAFIFSSLEVLRFLAQQGIVPVDRWYIQIGLHPKRQWFILTPSLTLKDVTCFIGNYIRDPDILGHVSISMDKLVVLKYALLSTQTQRLFDSTEL
ncbi:hypothetical protein ADUPG1_006440 [Aduncisulcus paluster]|uniref:Uncharacterized protein n=1 Tax=Aduncisulcus paluster TaxID=2918883 RepID=A0ABQ5KI93_9EUKA|nr:hypothetical protein ADUPG1_006440 [Aduncisulcus paluster]